MDSLHVDNNLLEQPNMVHLKSIPEALDAAGFIHAVRRLRDEVEVFLFEFVRAQDIAMVGAIAVDARHRLAAIEGNFLCFGDPPRNELLSLWIWGHVFTCRPYHRNAIA